MKINLLLYSIIAIFTYSQPNNKKCVCKIKNPYNWLERDKQNLLNLLKDQNISTSRAQDIKNLIQTNNDVRIGTIMLPAISLFMLPFNIKNIATSLNLCDLLINTNHCTYDSITANSTIALLGFGSLVLCRSLYQYLQMKKKLNN